MGKQFWLEIIKDGMDLCMFLWMALHIFLMKEFPFNSLRAFWIDLFFLLVCACFIITSYYKKKKMNLLIISAEIIYVALLGTDIVFLF